MGFLDLVKRGVAINNSEPKTPATRAKKDRNPVTSDLRLFRDGSIYPSATLVKKYNLEYQHKDDTSPGNGFDVIDSRAWVNTANSETPFLMITAVFKDAPKVDLFGQTRYNDDGTPASSVMTQGTKTFGLKLWEMLHEVYGTEIPTKDSEKDYVDLDIVEDDEFAQNLLTATNGIFNVPKTIARGDDKGLQTYTRREKLVMSFLIPSTINNNAAVLETNGGIETENVGDTIKNTVTSK